MQDEWDSDGESLRQEEFSLRHKARNWGSYHRPAWTGEQQMVLQMIRVTRHDYGDARMRDGIESWLQGDPAPISFDAVCTLLHIDHPEALKRYIREGNNPVARDQEESANGSLAADRVGRDGSGDTGPERLLQGSGSVDRAEAGSLSSESMATQLDQAAHCGWRECLGDSDVESNPSLPLAS